MNYTIESETRRQSVASRQCRASGCLARDQEA
jgi:hypothetical protein